jgi:acyl dehydratase
MGMREFGSLEELRGAVGEQFGPSDWQVVDQARIDAFAAATGDDQWIHVDPERAKAGPFGTTIAHGYLTLSLAPVLMRSLYAVSGARMGVNYGLNRVRFPAPVPSGSRVRASGELLEATPVEGGVQTVVRLTFEAEGQAKPVCVADTVARVYA